MDVTGNPWIVNAADVAGLAANSGNGNKPGDVITISAAFFLVVWRGPVSVLQVEMQDYAADTDIGKVARYNGVSFCDLNGAADLETVRSGVVGWSVDGLLIPNNGITNGSIRIYHR